MKQSVSRREKVKLSMVKKAISTMKKRNPEDKVGLSRDTVQWNRSGKSNT